ncbi:MAG TPA: hypothetical protein VHQ89_03770 [Gaiellaceae bacterium]|jgi:hypothetical protein|nr:hypothetical protein [Gaiellaceae bacterium]
MTRYDVFLFLHILSVILWVGAGTTLGLLWFHPDRELRRRIAPIGEWLGPRVFAPAALGALVFGLLLVHDGHWTFHPLFVQLGLAAFGLSFVVNAGVRAPLSRKLADHPQRLDGILSALSRFELSVLYLTVADMVLKPDGSDTVSIVVGAMILVVTAALVVVRAQA